MPVTTALRIRLATRNDIEAIHRFDARIANGGRRERISFSRALLGEANDDPHSPVGFRLMIAEDGSEIRAATLLFRQELFVEGQPRKFFYVQMPISEGIVNRAYSTAIIHLLKDLMVGEEPLMTLGVGSTTDPWARLAMSLGWKHSAVPFLFYPVKLRRVLLGLKYLDSRPRIRTAARLAARSGGADAAGWLRAAQLRLRQPAGRATTTRVERFEDWADDVFQSAIGDYPVTARRDSAALNAIYAPEDPRFRRLRIMPSGSASKGGWMIVCAARFSNHRYFGDLKVGVLVDGFGAVSQVPTLVYQGLNHLIDAGVDLIVCNWSHPAWVDACRSFGFLNAASNYHSFVSKQAAHLLPVGRFHFTRGDSDGMNAFHGADFSL